MHWISSPKYFKVSFVCLESIHLLCSIWKMLSDPFPFTCPAHVFNESKTADSSSDFCISARISSDFCKVALNSTAWTGTRSLLSVPLLRSRESNGRQRSICTPAARCWLPGGMHALGWHQEVSRARTCVIHWSDFTDRKGGWSLKM